MRIPDPLYAEILRSMPIPCVDLLVTDPADRILMIRRVNPPAQGEWWFPGGRVLYRERRSEAARRKLREECGLVPDAVHELGTFDAIFEGDQGPGAPHGISTVYHLNVTTTDVRLDGQSTKFSWRSLDRWLSDHRHPFVISVL